MPLDARSYSYLLGIYLGDGYIARPPLDLLFSKSHSILNTPASSTSAQSPSGELPASRRENLVRGGHCSSPNMDRERSISERFARWLATGHRRPFP
jgi:hypothetical protein